MERTNATTMRPAGRPGTPVVGRSHVMLVALAALTATVVGCGSGSGGKPSDGGPGGSGSGPISWRDGGTLHTASFAAAARVKSAMLDLVQVTGSNSAGAGVSFGVGDTPPVVAGSYSCGDTGTSGRRVVTISSLQGSASSTVWTACSIEITSLGDTTGSRVVGTFTATLSFDDGTTHVITDGKYDAPLTVSML